MIRKDVIGPDGHPSQASGKGNNPWGVYLAYRREIDEYLIAARRQIANPQLKLPFARPIGLVSTTRGLGLLVERISKNGVIVPSLQTLRKNQDLTEEHVLAVRRFFTYCIRHHIVLGDVHLGNLVVSPTDPQKLICIDGFGEKTLIPVHRYSHRLNQRKLARILKTLGLE